MICCVLVLPAISQSRKPTKNKSAQITLFTINKEPVSADEFAYLYKKNHQGGPEFTKEKILEYLTLYINFKLKVKEARDRGMDTTEAFRKEFRTYRNELLKPYLPEAKIIDSLIHLTYARLKEEVRASHILIGLRPDATPEDTLMAYNRIVEIREKANAGEDFGGLALQYSEDPSAKVNRGDLGYFTALQMVHPFETAAYQTPVGQVSTPVKTRFGYHLIKVVDRKPSRGEVEVSHIMIRTDPEHNDEEKAKDVIFEVYDQLRAGAAWDELCKQYSEDPSSKNNGGRLRPFGVGAMGAVPEFEQVAFDLNAPGDISDPFKTAYGWHIIKLERKIPLSSLEELTPTLKNKVARDERLQISKQAWQTKLKKEFKFKETEKTKSAVLALSDSLVSQGKWDNALNKEILFTLNGIANPAEKFLSYAHKSLNQGTRRPSGQLLKLYDNYVESHLMDALAEKIALENTDFKFLMNEYYEGILLFEIMEKEVWNKAVEDSVGLRDFYNRNIARFQAGERAKAILYSTSSAELTENLKQLIINHDSLSIDEFVTDNGLRKEAGAYEKDEKSVLSQINWAKGVYSAQNEDMHYIVWIQEILPPGPKAFEEAKASVVADYQQELEEIWLAELRKKYPVKVNEKGKRHILETLQR